VKYIVQGGDSFPSIAEQFGRSGQWQAIAVLNKPETDDIPPIDPGSPTPGMRIDLPDEWDTGEGEAEPEDEIEPEPEPDPVPTPSELELEATRAALAAGELPEGWHLVRD